MLWTSFKLTKAQGKPASSAHSSRIRVPRSIVELQQATMQGGGNCLRPVGHLELAEQIADVKFDCDLGDSQFGSDFLVAEPFGYELQHLGFSRREVFLGRAFSQALRDRFRDAEFPGIH